VGGFVFWWVGCLCFLCGVRFCWLVCFGVGGGCGVFVVFGGFGWWCVLGVGCVWGCGVFGVGWWVCGGVCGCFWFGGCVWFVVVGVFGAGYGWGCWWGGWCRWWVCCWCGWGLGLGVLDWWGGGGFFLGFVGVLRRVVGVAVVVNNQGGGHGHAPGL
ncbi:hypothetical protein RA276_28025, partial [Pseudomonas syringae pv. tagetis]|uniref:hypothetical protein n=1 Tax=Pseudomonas syringae group genomosp. 7 TaxID=251699 RepID=UPI003770724C